MPNGGDGLEIITIETPGLGDRSYLAVADGWCVAVDPQRDIDRVERILEERGLRLGAVLETHVHNDYVTGGLALARRHDAAYAVPAGPPLGFSATRVGDGDELAVGPHRVTVLDSPGHTVAHAAYALGSEGAAPARGPRVVFTGGSLLFGGTGRTDLLGPDLAEDLARRQYRSVRRIVERLPGDTLVCPTHGFGSFCAAGPSAGGGPTLSEQRMVSRAFHLDEDAFVAETLASLGAYPRYFALMGPRNAGLPTAADLSRLPAVPPGVLAAGAPRTTRGVVVDVRPRAAWAAAHVEGSLAVEAGTSLATWFGWVAPIESTVTLVASSWDEAADARRELERIGVDSFAGACVTPDLTTLLPSPGLRGGVRLAGFAELAAARSDDSDLLVLDVRDDDERRAARIPGSRHIPTSELAGSSLDELRGREAWIHCAAGFRATIAASLLEPRGVRAVIVDDEFAVALDSGLAVAGERVGYGSRARGVATRTAAGATPR